MYVDESGNTDLKPGRFYVISGIIVHQSKIDYIETEISNYRSTYFKGKYTTTEIHIHKIWQGKEPFQGIDPNTKHFLLNKLYQLINTLPFTAVSVVINKLLMRTGNYVNWNATKACWTFITERFDMFIGDNDYSEKGMLIVDKNSRAVDDEITGE